MTDKFTSLSSVSFLGNPERPKRTRRKLMPEIASAIVMLDADYEEFLKSPFLPVVARYAEEQISLVKQQLITGKLTETQREVLQAMMKVYEEILNGTIYRNTRRREASRLRAAARFNETRKELLAEAKKGHGAPGGEK